MSGKLGRDNTNQPIQGFAPTRIQSVSGLWTPGGDDVAFCVAADCTYTINATGDSGSLKAGAIRVIVLNQTYTFDTAQNLEVMGAQ